MLAGVLKMYVDNTIIERLRDRFGIRAGTNVGLFFEEWRNYGQDWVMERYPERSVYYYIDILMREGLMVKESKGKYRPAPGFESLVKS